jgi:predicted DNA-binding transcriptional regulator AlpA
MTQNSVEPLLNEKQLADWLGMSLPSLQRMRSKGSGPKFVQLSQRRIAYRRSVVERWLEERTIDRIGAMIALKQPPASPRERRMAI